MRQRVHHRHEGNGVYEPGGELVKKFGVTVVSPGYWLVRLHPWPAAAEDCFAVLQFMDENRDRLGISSLMAGGESAGGGLAAAVCMMARDRGRPGGSPNAPLPHAQQFRYRKLPAIAFLRVSDFHFLFLLLLLKLRSTGCRARLCVTQPTIRAFRLPLPFPFQSSRKHRRINRFMVSSCPSLCRLARVT